MMGYRLTKPPDMNLVKRSVPTLNAKGWPKPLKEKPRQCLCDLRMVGILPQRLLTNIDDDPQPPIPRTRSQELKILKGFGVFL